MAGDSGSGDGGLTAAADRIRETAKWLTVSLGTVGALLLAGTQFSSIGELIPGTTRFWIALGGGLLAGLGTFLVLVGSVRTATTPVITLDELAGTKPPGGTKHVRKDRQLLGVHNSAKELADAYFTATTQRRTAIDEYYADPENDAKEDEAERAQSAATIVGEQVARLIALSSYEHLSHRWRQALALLGIGGAIAAIGVAAFVWAANPPDEVKASTLSPGVVKSAKQGTLTLNAAGREALDAPGACDVRGPVDVLIVGTTDAGPDVVLTAAGCDLKRAIITPTWGTVTQAVN